MKTASFLLAFYILLQTLQPCGECWAEMTHEFDTASPSMAKACDQSVEECTPFCVFTCCNTTVPAVQQVRIGQAEIQTANLAAKAISLYESRYTFDHFSSIWQPPKA